MARIKGEVPTLEDRVYKSTVPDDTPVDEHGRALPYVVLWSVPGYSNDEEEDVSGDTEGGLTWEGRITVAAGDPDWCEQTSVAVVRAIDHWLMPGNVERFRANTQWIPVATDTEVLPNRWYIVLIYRAAFHPDPNKE